MAPIEQLFKASSFKFSSSGREDVDVQMLGRGRPFVVELVLPRVIRVTTEMMAKVQVEINSCQEVVKVRDLQVVSKEEVKELKKGEEDKIKKYRALCVVRGGVVSREAVERLNKMQGGIELRQHTPIRVLHRRVLANRSRMIHHVQVAVVDCFGGSKKRRHKDLENYLNEVEENDGNSQEITHADPLGGKSCIVPMNNTTHSLDSQPSPHITPAANKTTTCEDGNSSRYKNNNNNDNVNNNNNNNNNNNDNIINYNDINNNINNNNNNLNLTNISSSVISDSEDDKDALVTLLVVHLTTQAGTYIKEFVHGDFSRTLPNLGSLLGVQCDILLLDVMDVMVEWPKPLDSNLS